MQQLHPTVSRVRPERDRIEKRRCGKRPQRHHTTFVNVRGQKVSSPCVLARQCECTTRVPISFQNSVGVSPTRLALPRSFVVVFLHRDGNGAAHVYHNTHVLRVRNNIQDTRVHQFRYRVRGPRIFAADIRHVLKAHFVVFATFEGKHVDACRVSCIQNGFPRVLFRKTPQIRSFYFVWCTTT